MKYFNVFLSFKKRMPVCYFDKDPTRYVVLLSQRTCVSPLGYITRMIMIAYLAHKQSYF